MSLFSCAGSRPATLGLKGGRLAPCAATPNCVSSDASDPAHAIAAFQLIGPAAESWRALVTTVENWPRVKVITRSDNYLHAECSSRVFGFVDDLELHLRAAENIVSVRSAARLGHSDFGVNRRRVEGLRTALQTQGIVR